MKRPFYLNPDEAEVGMPPDGETDGTTYYTKVAGHQRSYGLPDELLYALLDRGITTIVLLEPSRRLTSDIEDWTVLGEQDPTKQYRWLNVSHMGV